VGAITATNAAATLRLRMTQVVIVEDDAALAAALEAALGEAGITSALAATGEEGLARVRSHAPALVLLEVGLSGLEICRRLRADPSFAELAIVLVGARAAEADRIEGFLAGADDFVAKPFSMRELVLRVTASLKRRKALPARLECGPIALAADGTLRVAGAEVELTALEVRLLRELMSNAGRVRTRAELIAKVWGGEHANSRTLDTHVLRLREKLKKGRLWLETVRGVGYRMKSSR
jgi:two-component system phosphate regulon response regulator PhoB